MNVENRLATRETGYCKVLSLTHSSMSEGRKRVVLPKAHYQVGRVIITVRRDLTSLFFLSPLQRQVGMKSTTHVRALCITHARLLVARVRFNPAVIAAALDGIENSRLKYRTRREKICPFIIFTFSLHPTKQTFTDEKKCTHTHSTVKSQTRKRSSEKRRRRLPTLACA